MSNKSGVDKNFQGTDGDGYFEVSVTCGMESAKATFSECVHWSVLMCDDTDI